MGGPLMDTWHETHPTCAPLDEEEEGPPAPRALDGRYLLGPPLGRGGMAVVFRAVDLQTREVVAVKLLDGAVARDARLLRRFANEAVTMRFLGHPHVAVVRDMGEDAATGLSYVVMDLARRGSAADALRARGPLPAPEVAGWAVQVCSALHAAHTHGIVHRDVKSANILLNEDGGALLADFGVARTPHADLGPERRVGTLSFMAPEQLLRADEAKAPADVYGLGATVYHLVTGVAPRQLYRAPRSDRSWDVVPPPLREVVFRATRPRPEERFADARELAFALLSATTDGFLDPHPHLRAWLAA